MRWSSFRPLTGARAKKLPAATFASWAKPADSLVLGAGGGLSTFAVSLAPRRVLAYSSPPRGARKIERAKELGAEAGVEYTAPDWPEEVRSLTGGTGVDVVIDSVGSTWLESLRCLRNGGRCVVLGRLAARG
jgi:zinc-binding alcohol dehydrogenase/oxidoreductase